MIWSIWGVKYMILKRGNKTQLYFHENEADKE